MTDYDYIIIGSGASGSVIASRLTEMPGARILLLEQGRRDSNPMLRLPAGFIKMIGGHRDVYIHESAPQPSLNGRRQTIVQGQVLGGSTSVNAMVYMRGRAAEYDHWADLTGHEGWNWQNMLARFKKQEGNRRFNDAYHNPHGPLKVSDSNHFAEMSYRFVQAMQELGSPHVLDFNRGRPDGVGFMQYTIDRARRCSVVDAYLRPAMKNSKNLTVRTGAKVSKINIENGRARSVTIGLGADAETIHAQTEVIVTSGALMTPQLLMLSGIGDPEILKRFDLPVISPLKGVGQNLQDHHEVPILASTHRQMGYFGEDKGWRMVKNGLQYLLFRSGPVSTIGVEATAFVMPDGTGDPIMQIFCIPTIYLDRDVAGFAPTKGVTFNALLLRPKARGTVTLRSANPTDPPLINPNFLGNDHDLDWEIKGIAAMREILKTSVLRDEINQELLPGPDVTDRKTIAEYCRKTVKTGYHPVGTAKMGAESDKMAVLTPDLKVKGIDGLRVCDASIMPVIVSANTNAPVQAIADHAADMIINDAKGQASS
jgi:choline dehydrogenase